ncbi:cilia- and flagella-associated protein 70-like [Cylas formicarius]|uniref:cilia- and flagella-associated protein 70-like n=1 Tax=Cylas formicarius TaxID=197179 RepID=UPI002958D6C9|nr:cilia- and flagella-associated protein 70-like [Cylas formicarius]
MENQGDPGNKSGENTKAILIKLETYKCITPLYPVTNVKTTLKYLDTVIGETRPVLLTDDENCLVDETFEIEFDSNSVRELDLLASNPIMLTVMQSIGTMEASVLEQLKEMPVREKPTDSLFSLYEMFTGVRIDAENCSDESIVSKKSGNNGEKMTLGKNSKKSPKPKLLNNDVNSNKSTSVKISESELYGVCAVDLIPILYGEVSFTETIAIKPIKDCFSMMNTYMKYPQIAVTVSTKDKKKIIEIDNLLSFTIESIFNPPSSMSTMDCAICILLPLGDDGYHPSLFKNSKVARENISSETEKRWFWSYDEPFEDSVKMKYFINYSDIVEIKSKEVLDLNKAIHGNRIRLEFNVMKRNILFSNAIHDFAMRLKAYRKILLEIMLTSQDDRSKRPHLHLMAVVDVSSLLLPGSCRVRLATPLTTFNLEQASKIVGLEDSYFLPTLKPQSSMSKLNLETLKKRKGEKISKSSKKGRDLIHQLPNLPDSEYERNSLIVHGDDENPCFVVVEVELLSPINPRRNIDELVSDLQGLLTRVACSSKKFVSVDAASEFYKQTITAIIEDLNKKYREFSEKCLWSPTIRYQDFVKYLEKTGSYYSYVTSISTAVELLVTNKYHYDQEDLSNSVAYQNLICEAFSSLVSDAHKVLNSFLCSNAISTTQQHKVKSDESLFFAKEAAEIGRHDLSDRYFLQRILSAPQQSAEVWFQYAIYNLEINNRDKAFECVKEAVARQSSHRHSLLLFGILLADKGDTSDAETCLLNVTIRESKWIEAWGVLYVFYQINGKEDDMDVAHDMAVKYMEEPKEVNDFNIFEDLAWCTVNIPDTLFFKTAILLIKMRIYSWAESALAHEVAIDKHYGNVNYLLAVISYYRGNFSHALEYLEEAKEVLGSDFAILSLFGHCLLALKNYERAQEEYHHVIESYNRPEVIHLVYVNCSVALKQLGDLERARKLILIACKYHQTPYVWMTAGKLYYELNDLVSAEECFSEANIKDNMLPEVWGFLTLINIKLGRIMEAKQCYQQAVKCRLDDEALLAEIQNEFRKC